MMDETAVVRGAPKTRASSIRLRELLADFIGPQRARAVVERMTASGLLPQGTRRFSTPVSVREAALSLIVAACDAGDAQAAIDRATRVAACEHYIDAGEPSGPTVVDALTAAIDAVRDDPAVEPREWHFGLACTKELTGGEHFKVYLPERPADPTASSLWMPFERIDVLPGSAVRHVAGLWS